MQKNFKNVISTIMWYIPSALRNFKDLTHKTIYYIPSKEDFYHPKHPIYYLSKEISYFVYLYEQLIFESGRGRRILDIFTDGLYIFIHKKDFFLL